MTNGLHRPGCALGLAAFLLAFPACRSKSGGGVGGVGTAVASGSAADLRVTPDGKVAAYLVDAEKPRLDGIPPQMLVGELHVAPLTGGGSRKVGNGVTNVPGGYLFSADSRWLLYLASYNAASQSGELHVLDLSDPTAGSKKWGSNVTYLLISPDSKVLAFVADGVLKLQPLGEGLAKEVAGEVSTATFAPDGKTLYFKRRLSAAGGLHFLVLGSDDPPRKLADQVGDYAISPDGRHVALAQRSEVARSTYDLLFASAPQMRAVKIADGTSTFAFSPDGKYFARTEGGKPELLGDLFVGPPDGSPGRRAGMRVQEFSFAPDSSALAYLEHYDISARAGLVGVLALPDGKPKRVGDRSPNYTWGADGRFLAFLSRFIKPIYSVDLMLFAVGEEAAFKVNPGVFGYGFTAGNEQLLFRTNCIRNGRACDLYALDLARLKEPPKKIVEGIYSFKPSEKGQRLLVSYARTEGELFDAAVFNFTTGERKTLEQSIHLPAIFLDDSGSRVAYVVADRKRAGVYVANQVP